MWELTKLLLFPVLLYLLTAWLCADFTWISNLPTWDPVARIGYLVGAAILFALYIPVAMMD